MFYDKTVYSVASLLENQLKYESTNSGTTLTFKEKVFSNIDLWVTAEHFANKLKLLSLPTKSRIAYYGTKTPSEIISLIACSINDFIFVPINPLLKSHQVQFILNNCGATVLISGKRQHELLEDTTFLEQITYLYNINENDLAPIPIKFDKKTNNKKSPDSINDRDSNSENTFHERQCAQTRCILYTSGSTGKPKGVSLSEKNLVLGAQSVCEYLKITDKDRILALLPFSFDYGLNQLICCLYSGANIILHDYFLPVDVKNLVEKHHITGLAGVPTLWRALTKIKWEKTEGNNLRFFTNSGGKLPTDTLHKLLNIFPNAEPYLMYGLTEAFRSTYLPPAMAIKKPESIGNEIPNAHIYILNKKGEQTEAYEYGELVHCGPLVSLGYWNNLSATQKCFCKAPDFYPFKKEYPIALWSGDTVYKDEDGFLYFLSRQDTLIKTSGYRVSPEEVEEVIYGSGFVHEVVVVGLDQNEKETKIIAYLSLIDNDATMATQNKTIIHEIKQFCLINLPNFMQPSDYVIKKDLPKNSNGKYDRNKIANIVRKNFHISNASK